ncbi:MAG TPA: ureidoglycolate lyase [Algoriphagus sp.]|jgi:2-keto-4-pentenoate hydratase/2-oxohepta-3-ene-1,7-dioic acid hydratase in catechol pathway|uniref:fumarylacetoacetate hydrolase family protein n=1 Tax=unclassified Algoriphagus TaxID=2641541 RepID=UPI000C5DDE66|nr:MULTISPECIES: fumarylacetoacetate hydrolase family protein [unclassified Algoriphagus]MAL15207.1 ureidoglycolate lyase [Algoriphagus sp.]MAN85433.1 ureidoglycolate lyase [Algoriphagus sp.]QYH37835.1 fumarylacetoacetate hydrolase family protein [Algoriphagus sp. NBT04N3]HAD50250.1 ureidoglycolate lyase [Algoriphagus sp.]HAS60212.1 ureidoglycolate lyase [Algoriphagus sp.]|tara:strand:+ start:4209 stop:5072 length:864 start_codon:yes stop_codon:yes gene_type:complete
MKLIRFGEKGQEKPGIQNSEGKNLDCSSFGEDWNETFLTNNGLERLKVWLQANQSKLPEIPANSRLASPIARPSKIICVGLNYRKHAAEAGMAVPEVPILFMKATSSLSGPYDPIFIPRNSKKTDWEVELAVVIGKRAKYVSVENAMDHVAGYCLHNDVSERDFQLNHGGQWVKGKSADNFAPLGPFLATKEEIPDPHQLRLWLKLNGKILQDSSTSDLIFDIPTIVSHISQYMTLLPGDIISTGTPAGVGMGLKPEPKYLEHGDVVELGIEGLGISRQVAINDPEA